MHTALEAAILRITGASSIIRKKEVQSLWSGYGSLFRCWLAGFESDSIIVKFIQLQKKEAHPRGWNSSFSHQRKLRSYQIESKWYSDYSNYHSELCKIPHCIGIEETEDGILLLLEDLRNLGYSSKPDTPSAEEVQQGIQWLAHFHALHMNRVPSGLWSIGTYWHLDTRPEELKKIKSTAIGKKAKEIDQILNNTQFKTLVHGDAKLANFLFLHNGSGVAAVDFQYIGGGCGMKDLAYFISSCLTEQECETQEDAILNYYFNCLEKGLELFHPTVSAKAVEAEWRPLYAMAWADFNRFLLGWSPDHWKLNAYSLKITEQIVNRI